MWGFHQLEENPWKSKVLSKAQLGIYMFRMFHLRPIQTLPFSLLLISVFFLLSFFSLISGFIFHLTHSYLLSHLFKKLHTCLTELSIQSPLLHVFQTQDFHGSNQTSESDAVHKLCHRFCKNRYFQFGTEWSYATTHYTCACSVYPSNTSSKYPWSVSNLKKLNYIGAKT